MANLKEIAAALAILSAGTLTLSGCKKEETTTPDEVKAGDSAGEAAADGEAADGGAADGEASCSGEKAADGEASCSGEAAADGAAADGEASCSGEKA